MRFGYTILYVRDVAAALDFYERAFGQERRFVHESGQYAELETGTTTLAFAAHELAALSVPAAFNGGARDDHRGPAFEICFVTDDVEAAFARAVDAGAVEASLPARKPWGQEVAYVRDLDGNLVEIASPVS
jgi:catechol 2,3-dioxygenase-like lactoylglutathione lyase family enzyme